MSEQEERLDTLEDLGEKVQRPDDCIFCHVRSSGFKNSIYHELSDIAVKDFFIQHEHESCDHTKVGPFSVLFSNFLGASLLQYVFDNHLEKQNDYDFINSIFQDKKIMIEAIDTEAKRSIKQLTEGTLKYVKGDEYDFWKGRIDNISIYAEWAKEMYEK